jgi:hypothetical protein
MIQSGVVGNRAANAPTSVSKISETNGRFIMERLNTLAKRLSAHGFEVKVFETAKEAADWAVELAKGTKVAIGGCLTAQQLGIYDRLKAEAGTAVFWHWYNEEDRREGYNVDYYFASANGISMNGEIVNIDGSGNRVSHLVFGPKNSVYLIGRNKIEDTLDQAMERARVTATVKNAIRLNRKPPCTVDGKCHDCHGPECLCSIITIHRQKTSLIKTYVALINEDLGY